MAKPSSRASRPNQTYSAPARTLRREASASFPFTSDPASLFSGYNLLSPVVRSPDLLSVEDHRAWHPDFRMQTARSSRRYVARSSLKPVQSDLRFQREILRFRHPRHVIICARRKSRKEVLHALGKTGRGSGFKRFRRRVRRDAYSSVAC